MLKASAADRAKADPLWLDLAMLAELLIQSGAPGLPAARVTIWWRAGSEEGYRSLATGDRFNTYRLNRRMSEVPCIRHRYRPGTAHGATTNAPLLIQIPLRVGPYQAGVLTLERDSLVRRTSCTAQRQALRTFRDHVGFTLYRYQREAALHAMFRVDQATELPAVSAHRSVLGYWADGAFVVDQSLHIVDVDDGLARLFGYPDREALIGRMGLDLFDRATAFALHPGQRVPRQRRLTGIHHASGERINLLVLPVSYPGASGLTQVLVRDVADLLVRDRSPSQRPPPLELLDQGVSLERIYRRRVGQGDAQGTLGVAILAANHERWLHHAYGRDVGLSTREHIRRVLLTLRRRGDLLVEAPDGRLVVVVAARSEDDACVILEQMCEAVAHIPAPTPRGELQVTLAMGVAYCDRVSDLDSTFSRAHAGAGEALHGSGVAVDAPQALRPSG